PVVSTDSSSYAAGATVTVTYTGLSGNVKDWIAIATSGADTTEYVAWVFTNGQTSGTATLTAPGIGAFVARAFENNTYTLIAESTTFMVAGTSISTDRATYRAGSTVTVTYAGLPGNAKDWIAIAPAGSSNTEYVAWVFTNGQASGTATFTAPPRGSFLAALLLSNNH